MENVNVSAEDLKKLIIEVSQIKKMLLAEKEKRGTFFNHSSLGKSQMKEKREIEEIELTDWAKNELEEARKRKTKISHEKAREILFAK